MRRILITVSARLAGREREKKKIKGEIQIPHRHCLHISIQKNLSVQQERKPHPVLLFFLFLLLSESSRAAISPLSLSCARVCG